MNPRISLRKHRYCGEIRYRCPSENSSNSEILNQLPLPSACRARTPSTKTPSTFNLFNLKRLQLKPLQPSTSSTSKLLNFKPHVVITHTLSNMVHTIGERGRETERGKEGGREGDRAREGDIEGGIEGGIDGGRQSQTAIQTETK